MKLVWSGESVVCPWANTIYNSNGSAVGFDFHIMLDTNMLNPDLNWHPYLIRVTWDSDGFDVQPYELSETNHEHIELSGITESSITKSSATFGDLVVTGSVTFSVDQLDFQSLTASSILVNGSSVALEGHGHSASDISDFSDAVVSAGASVFASTSHSHDGLQGLTSSSISKDSASFNSISASTATFDNLVVTGDVSLSLSQVQFGSIMASEISVNGSQVSLDGHVHGMSEIDGLESSISQLNASVSSFASAMSGLDATSISKSFATFDNLVVTGSVTFSADQLDFDTLTASTILLNGSSVAVEGHLHSMSEIQGLESSFSQVNASLSTFSNDLQGIEPTSISKSTATFGDLTVTGSLTLSLDELQFGSIMASEITVNGSSVSLEGHLHSIPDISGLSSILSGITESSVSKNQVTASTGTFDNITADVGNFRLISVSGSANFAVNNVSASSVSVNGTPVSLEGHVHTMSQITGLESYVQAFATYESRIAYLEGIVSALSTTYVTRSEFVELSASIESILDDIISGQAAAESQINQI